MNKKYYIKKLKNAYEKHSFVYFDDKECKELLEIIN